MPVASWSLIATLFMAARMAAISSPVSLTGGALGLKGGTGAMWRVARLGSSPASLAGARAREQAAHLNAPHSIAVLTPSPPTTARFGRPLELSRVHWVRPELVAEVTFLTWTADGLLRQVVYEGLREDKAARTIPLW